MTQWRGAKMALFEMLFVVDHVTTSRISEWVERMMCWRLWGSLSDPAEFPPSASFDPQECSLEPKKFTWPKPWRVVGPEAVPGFELFQRDFSGLEGAHWHIESQFKWSDDPPVAWLYSTAIAPGNSSQHTHSQKQAFSKYSNLQHSCKCANKQTNPQRHTHTCHIPVYVMYWSCNCNCNVDVIVIVIVL